MKSYERAILYILVIGLAGAYLLHFTGISSDNTLPEKTDSNAVKIATPKAGGPIYYVNTDTVWDNYEYVQEVFKKLEGRKAQYENQLEKQVRDFEREVTAFQEKGRSMSEVELQIKQRDLMKKESELTKLKDDLEIKWMKEEKEWNDKLREAIINFIDNHTKEKNYDYILGYSATSNIILANDSLDLTTEVIEGLNNEYYEKNKNKEENKNK